MATTSGRIPFDVPGAGKPCETWYEIYGDLSTSTSTPLIFLHGGPGAGHGYLTPYGDLSKAPYSTPVILYDQLGCGNSTLLPEKRGDEAFWTPDLFCRELDNLIDALNLRARGFHLGGNSWGGMLSAEFATRKPEGLKRLILSNSPASGQLFVQSCQRLIHRLPDKHRDAILRCERDRTFDDAEYKAAEEVFYKRHVCLEKLRPCEELEVAMRCFEADATVYNTMNGPSEFSMIGPLKDWSIIERLHLIDAPTLLINGEHDEVQDDAVQPFFDGIKRVRWVTMQDASHFSHVEQREKTMRLVHSFLTS